MIGTRKRVNLAREQHALTGERRQKIAYNVELDLVHLEYALLARAVRDTAARVDVERDREGIDTWGFARWRKLDANLSLVRRRM